MFDVRGGQCWLVFDCVPGGGETYAQDVHLPATAVGTMRYSDVHFTETWGAMEDLVKDGLVKSIGVSNFNRCAECECVGVYVL